MSSYYEKFLASGEVKCIDEEIPFEIPKGWEWSRIGSVLNIWSARRVHERDWRSSGIPFYRAREIGKMADWGHVDNDLFIEQSLYDEFSKSGVPQIGDLMMTAVGTLGKTYVVETNNPFYYKDGSVLCIGNPFRLNPYYLKLFFESFAFANQYLSESDGTTVATLTMVRLNKYLIPVPPLKEQKRIVERLHKISPFIERYSKSQDALNLMNMQIREQLKKSVLQEAIQGKLVPQILEEGTAQELLKRIKAEKEKLVKEGKLKKSVLTDSVIYKGDDNKYFEKKGKTEKDITEEIPFEIPDSWAWVRLSSISDIIGGYAFQSTSLKEKQGKRVIRISDFSEQGFVNTKIVRYDGTPISDIYKLRRFDILMAMTGGTVGKSLFIRELPETEILLNQRVARIRSLWINVDYLYFVIIAPHVKEFICKQKNSTNDNISMTDISNFIIPLPPIKEQIRIVKKLYNLASIMSR